MVRCRFAVALAVFAATVFVTNTAHAACTAAGTGVTICNPAANASVQTPVDLEAAASSGNASDPVKAMKVYIDGTSQYSVNASSISTQIAMTGGTHKMTVKGWTVSGAVLAKSISILVSTSCAATSGTVNICAPANGASATSPVHIIAAANASSGVKATKIYVDGVSKFSGTSASIVADIAMSAGARKITVKAWANDGSVISKTINITVTGATAGYTTETVADGLYVPWEMLFAPDGRMFFTEQRGRLRVIANGALVSTPLMDVRSQTRGGEQGMLGLEIDPAFSSNHRLYVYWCFITSSTTTGCRIDRVVVDSNTSSHVDKTLLQWAGSNNHHNAGRMKIGRDGFLYVSIGDWGTPTNAQSLSNYAGKVLRMNLDGTAAPGNPFAGAPYVFAMGFRDPQGLAFDTNGQLYLTDHGNVFNDEVDLVTIGGNYGWPNCEGSCTNSAYVSPLRVFTTYTIAPSGATFYNSSVIPAWTGSLLFASLGQSDDPQAHHLHRIKFAADGTTIAEEEVLFKDSFGRLRNVIEGPDGYVYISTSNGNYTDKIVRIKPAP